MLPGGKESNVVEVTPGWQLKGEPIYGDRDQLVGCSLYPQTRLSTSVQSIDQVTVCRPLDGSSPHILEATTAIPVSEGNLDMDFDAGRRPMTLEELRQHISMNYI